MACASVGSCTLRAVDDPQCAEGGHEIVRTNSSVVSLLDAHELREREEEGQREGEVKVELVWKGQGRSGRGWRECVRGLGEVGGVLMVGLRPLRRTRERERGLCMERSWDWLELHVVE